MQMGREDRRKLLLYYNPYSGNGVFKDNLDHIIERCQHAGFDVSLVRASRDYTIDDALAEENAKEIESS